MKKSAPGTVELDIAGGWTAGKEGHVVLYFNEVHEAFDEQSLEGYRRTSQMTPA